MLGSVPLGVSDNVLEAVETVLGLLVLVEKRICVGHVVENGQSEQMTSWMDHVMLGPVLKCRQRVSVHLQCLGEGWLGGSEMVGESHVVENHGRRAVAVIEGSGIRMRRKGKDSVKEKKGKLFLFLFWCD